jgi:hypothetical protein
MSDNFVIIADHDRSGFVATYRDHHDSGQRFEINVYIGDRWQIDHPSVRAAIFGVKVRRPKVGRARVTVDDDTFRGEVYCAPGNEAAAARWLRATATAMQTAFTEGWCWSAEDHYVTRRADARNAHVPTLA